MDEVQSQEAFLLGLTSNCKLTYGYRSWDGYTSHGFFWVAPNNNKAKRLNKNQANQLAQGA